MSTRIDSFIIWPNGIQHLEEIVAMIRDKFEIIMLYRKSVSEMDVFVDQVYGCDTYPLKHIRSKIKYLKKYSNPRDVFFILVRNHHVNERIAGKGKFRKPQCMYLQSVKVDIRERFNPSKDHHVIHGTDYEAQVDYLLRVFGLKKKSYYTRAFEFPVHYPYHLSIPRSWSEEVVSVSDLRVNIIGRGKLKIEDSPHYAYVTGNREEYQQYFYKHIGKELKEDHFPDKFDWLIENLSNDPDPLIVSGSLVLDGVHRLAILRHRGMGKVKTIKVQL